MENESITRYRQKKARRKKRRKVAFFTFLTVLMIAVIAVLSLTVFFNIKTITVSGNERYSESQIISACGIPTGKNMFRFNKFKIIERMKNEMPYVADVTIRRKLPNTLSVTVTEAKPFGCITSENGNYVVDETLKVLEIADKTPENVAEIIGVTPVKTALGKTVTDENGICDVLLILTKALNENFGSEGITSVDVTSSYDVKFMYQNRVEVRLGSVDKMTVKSQLARYVIDENGSSERAIVDVSDGERAFYRSVTEEDEEEEAPEETPDGEAEKDQDTDTEGEQEKDTEKDA